MAAVICMLIISSFLWIRLDENLGNCLTSANSFEKTSNLVGLSVIFIGSVIRALIAITGHILTVIFELLACLYVKL